MATHSLTVETKIAGAVQRTAEQYNCELIELGVAGNGTAKITIKGEPEAIDQLLAAAGYVEPKQNTENEQ